MIHCNVAFELWTDILRMFGVQWVLLEKDLNLLYGWWIRGSNSDIQNLTLFLMWTIWRERNHRTFEDVERTSTQIQSSYISSLYEWSIVSGLTNSNSIHSFIVFSFVDIFSIVILQAILCLFSRSSLVSINLFLPIKRKLIDTKIFHIPSQTKMVLGIVLTTQLCRPCT